MPLPEASASGAPGGGLLFDAPVVVDTEQREPTLAYVLGDALYLNLTSACTLACVFCPKIRDDDWTVGGFDLRLTRNPSADEVWAAAERAGIAGRSEVVFTGLGEPTRRLDVLLALARRLREAGVPAHPGRHRRAREPARGLRRTAGARGGGRLGASPCRSTRRTPRPTRALSEPLRRDGVRGREGVHPQRSALHPGRGGERGRVARALGGRLPQRRRVAGSAVQVEAVRQARPGGRRRLASSGNAGEQARSGRFLSFGAGNLR